MFWLMFGNVASGGLVFQDPERDSVLSQPWCVSNLGWSYASFLSAGRARNGS
jgi:hypothetical protein